ncbi:aldo/keto reductase [Pseudomassariella vexata]|uniref:Aldo/keto reductase n=1 Tax=Pseudomassariella vexata TaxID=1141098 RepID=A0A1Y2E0I1_9PEZI|nr:aldo/keto reductase [Pseudomassariella vexata]ORY64987.1 aldo/keto reductase [Pseudomassariella vexata]
MALPMALPPKSPLARYRLLSPTASVRVSPLCLGAMNFGDAWKQWMGACDKPTTEAILDFYYQQGGNFIDTANNYQAEESEEWIGDWMKQRGIRDQMVIATKYTTNFRAGRGETEIMANSTGNGSKSLRTSVEASLRKLKTDYIDLLYIHWWDFSTSIPELMQALNALVVSGKVLYLGISDSPAYIVSKANQYARDHGFCQFSVYQGKWSAANRDLEREILPMCREEGMGLAPWSALGGGKFKTEAQRKAQEGRKVEASETDIKVSQALETVANRKGTIITSVAQAYVMHKAPYVFPIIGGRNIDHLKANIEALTLSLSQEDIDEIEGAVPFDIGFPLNFLWKGKPEHPGDVWLLNLGGHYDYVAPSKPITPRGGE